MRTALLGAKVSLPLSPFPSGSCVFAKESRTMLFCYNLSKDIGESPFEEEAAKMSPKEGGKKERRGEGRKGEECFCSRHVPARRDRETVTGEGRLPAGIRRRRRSFQLWVI